MDTGTGSPELWGGESDLEPDHTDLSTGSAGYSHDGSDASVSASGVSVWVSGDGSITSRSIRAGSYLVSTKRYPLAVDNSSHRSSLMWIVNRKEERG